MQAITTRVFDTSLGVPAFNIPVRLERRYDGNWHPVGIAITDEAGHAHPRELNSSDDANDEDAEAEQPPLVKGDYRLTFEVAAYFKTRNVKSPYPFVQVVFTVSEIKDHHVPLLLSPFGYSTYLGQ